MDQGSGSRLRSRRQAAAVLAIAAVIAILLGAGLWAGSVGPFGVAQAPGTIYIQLTAEPSPSPSATASAAPTAEPTAAETASAAATAEASLPSPTAGAAATSAVTAAAVTAVATSEGGAVPTLPLVSFATPKPNLQFGSYTTPNLACGVSFTMTVGVRNSGTVASPASSVALLDSYPGITTVAANSPFAALAPGASVNVTFMFAVSRGCGLAHTLVLRIDPSGHVDETYELDNVLELTHTVRAPNLYLSDLTVPPHAPCASVTVNVRVHNNGSAATPVAGMVKFTDTYSGEPSYSKSVYVNFATVAAGASRIVSQTFPALSYCNHTHTVTAVVDPAGAILETNDGDNTAHADFHPDL